MRVVDRLFFVWLALGLASRSRSAARSKARWTARWRRCSGAAWSGSSSCTTSRSRSTRVCHFFGRRGFATEDESRNVFWLAPLSFGEAWHHNHHAFPTSAFHGLRWWEVDPGGWLIRGLERAGLVWNVRRISPERQAERLAAPVA